MIVQVGKNAFNAHQYKKWGNKTVWAKKFHLKNWWNLLKKLQSTINKK